MSAALTFENVSVRYGGRSALCDATVMFTPGKVTGIVGPNGAGKTTLLRAALNLLPLSGGNILVEDRPLGEWSREALARTIAYLPQGGEAHWPLLARDLVMLGRLPYRGHFSSPADQDMRAVNDAMARADVLGFADRRVDELSAGERARVLFARALATGAKILLADEPAAYLDPAHQLRLMGLLREEAARGTAVAVTLHDLALASRHCDEILVLHQGRVAAMGVPEAALCDAALASVFGISARRTADAAGGRAALTPWNLI
jgi:iron complex transport system ATP-binding protein